MTSKQFLILLCCLVLVLSSIYACFTSMSFKSIFGWLSLKLLKFNTKQTVNRIKTAKIIKRKDNLGTKYIKMVESLIADTNLKVTVEGFTSIMIICGILFTMMANVLLKDILVSILISVSSIVAFIAFMFSKARVEHERSIEHVMELEEMLCVKVKDGIESSIRRMLENSSYLDRRVYQSLKEFTDDIDHQGYSFATALERLNAKLGSQFDDFTKKAINFESNERAGMSDIFLDNIKRIGNRRQIRIDKEVVFKKISRDYSMITMIVAGFIGFTLFDKEMTGFLLGTFLGKALLSATIVATLLGYARIQVLQSGAGTGNRGVSK